MGDETPKHPEVSILLRERLKPGNCPRELFSNLCQGTLKALLECGSEVRPFDGGDTVSDLAGALTSSSCHAQKLLYEMQSSMADREATQAIAVLLDQLLILTNAVHDIAEQQ